MSIQIAIPTLATLAVALGSSPVLASDLDALGLARGRLAAEIPLQWDEDEIPLGSYLLLRTGLNLLEDPSLKTATFTVGSNRGLDGTGLPLDPLTPMTRGSLRDARIRVEPGIDLEIGFGLKIAEDVVIELATGVTWNSIERVEGTLDYVTVEPDGAGGENEIDWVSEALGGAGDIYQVPITVSVLYDGEIRENLRLTAGIGGGLEWSQLKSNGIRSARYSGAYFIDPDTSQPTLVPLSLSLDGEAIALRYQAMLGLSYEIFPGGFLGGYVRYSGTSALDYGTLGFGRSPDNLYREGGDLDVPHLRNLAVGASFTITF